MFSIRFRFIPAFVFACFTAIAQHASSQQPPTSEPIPGPRFCGNTANIPPGSIVISSGKKLVRTYIVGDAASGAPFQVKGYAYSCVCDSSTGPCYAVSSGTKIGCASQKCSDSTLQIDELDGLTAFRTYAMSCGAPQQRQETIIAQRLAEVEAWKQAYGIPDPIYSRNRAYGIEGYHFIVEKVGGTEIIYLVSDEFIDPITGLISPEVAPGSGGGPPTFRAIFGAGSHTWATCNCSSGGGGNCELTRGGDCKQGLCSGTCPIGSGSTN